MAGLVVGRDSAHFGFLHEVQYRRSRLPRSTWPPGPRPAPARLLKEFDARGEHRKGLPRAFLQKRSVRQPGRPACGLSSKSRRCKSTTYGSIGSNGCLMRLPSLSETGGERQQRADRCQPGAATASAEARLVVRRGARSEIPHRGDRSRC